MNTNEIIKEILIANDLSQDALAKILGVSQKAISNWINAVDTPKASSILLIYEKFGITPNELLGIEEPRQFTKLQHIPTTPPVPRPHAVPYAARSGAIGVAHLTDEQARKLDEILGLDPEEPDQKKK